MNELDLIEDLISRTEKLPHRDSNALDALKRRSEMVIRNLFGIDSKYLEDLSKIGFYPRVSPTDESYKSQRWRDAQQRMLNFLGTIKEEVMLFGLTAEEAQAEIQPREQTDEIFVVHGHDESMKQSIARTLEKLGLSPVILHDKPNQGRTIIEKFTDYSQVYFAIVLLSPDDIAYPKGGKAEEAKYRARQNVIFELGYFIGKLGRDRVVALYRRSEDFEMPSDYSGVLFIPFDAARRWQYDLVKELKTCGYSIDANRLME